MLVSDVVVNNSDAFVSNIATSVITVAVVIVASDAAYIPDVVFVGNMIIVTNITEVVPSTWEKVASESLLWQWHSVEGLCFLALGWMMMLSVLRGRAVRPPGYSPRVLNATLEFRDRCYKAYIQVPSRSKLSHGTGCQGLISNRRYNTNDKKS